jgi:hypothetical protein
VTDLLRLADVELQIRKLEIEPGDVVVFSTEDKLTAEQRGAIQAALGLVVTEHCSFVICEDGNDLFVREGAS